MKDFTHFSWDEIQALDHASSIIVLPVGSTEQHGPHLPVATDSLTAEYLAAKVAEMSAHPPMLVAPPFRYTYAKPSMIFPGTLTVEGETLVKLTRDALRSFFRQGFRRILIMNAHMENTDFLIEGTSLALEGFETSKVVLCNWWELVSVETVRKIFDPGWKAWEDEHAAVVETSLMLHIAPELVRTGKYVNGRRRSRFEFRIFPWDPVNFPEQGVFSEIQDPSAEKGEHLIQLLMEELKNLVHREFKD